MKLVTLAFAAILAVVAAKAAPQPGYHFCYRPGEPCTKLKRAADAVAEALAHPGMEARTNHFCYRPGEPCTKAKREALAMAEAVAEAHAMAFPEALAAAEPGYHFCYRPGEPCTKVKRAADIIKEAATSNTSTIDPTLEVAKAECYKAGEPCDLAEKALQQLYKNIKGN